MPYRRTSLTSQDGSTETFWVRITDAAVKEWLGERHRLRVLGFPDRPPDVDNASLRAWVPRLGEQNLPYFGGHSPARPRAESVWPIYTAVWHAPSGETTKVLVSAAGDGAIVSRVVVEHPSGQRPVDKTKVYPPDADPDTVWCEVEAIVMTIDAAPMDWGPDDPLACDYLDYLALGDEVETAEAEARTAGLLAVEMVH